MKKTLLTLIAVGLVSLTAPAATQRVSYYSAPRLDMTKSDAEFHTVMLDVAYDLEISQELNGLFAMESTGADTQVYYGYSEEEDGHVYQFDLPDGNYDFYVGATLGYNEGAMVLTLDEVEVTSDLNLELRSSSATYRTDIRHIAPDGSELLMAFDQEGGTVPSAQFIQALMHRGTLLLLGGFSTDSSGMNYIISNTTESNYTVTRLDIMHSPFGFLNMVIPVDFSKAESGSTADGWQMASEDFALTPANRKVAEFYAASGKPDYFYGFSPTVMIIDGKTAGTAGVGMFDSNCTTSTVGVWTPADYAGHYDLWPVATGASITGWGADISALPLKRTDEGLRQVGVNLFPDRLIYFCDESSPLVGPGFSAYSGAIPQTKLGNCTPLLVLIPEEEYFEFSFNGRHGEAISQAANYFGLPTPEYWTEIFGAPLCDLKFYRDGELICSDRMDFPYDAEWDEPADYRLEISTDNVLIDDEIPGFVEATHTFGPESDNLMPPTLTSLRIVDAEGAINDRPTAAEGAKAYFTGGHFTYNDNYEERYVYARFDPVECTSVEYSPRAAGNYLPLAVEELGEQVLPGYGNQFMADLSGVVTESADGWYDLRISIKDGSGATQTQVISPAFRLGNPGGIGEIITDKTTVDIFAPEAEIYTPDGRRVNPNAMTKGVYIVRTPAGTSKIIF